MMQLELEAGPMLLGFSIGTVFFTVMRLTAPRPPPDQGAQDPPPAPPPAAAVAVAETEAAVEEEPVEAKEAKEWEQWPEESEDEWEVAGEPGPEPSPRSETQVVAPPRRNQRLVLAGATLVLGIAFLVGGLWVGKNAAGLPEVELEQGLKEIPSLKADEPVSPEVVEVRMPEAAPLKESAPTVQLPEQQEEQRQLPAQAEQAEQAEQQPEQQPEQQQDEQEEKELEQQEVPPPVVEQVTEELFGAGPVVTLNLTRQQVAVMQDQEGDNIYYKSAYWGTINVGTPAEKFKVVFDTGSGHLIVPSTYCHSETCRAHRRYRRSISNTAVDIDYDGSRVKPGEPRDQITVSFGTGEVTGIFIQDMVCPHEQDPRLSREVTAAAQVGCMPLRMIAATDMSEEPFRTFEFDGVLGMGLPGLSQAPEFNFLNVIGQHLLEQGSRTPNLFSVFLAEHEEEGSTITLGGYASDRLEGQLSWNPVLAPELGHWLVRVKSVSIEGRKISFCEAGDCRAVVDTGTSLLAVPTLAFPEIYELLRHEADPEEDCRGPGPKLGIELENFMVELTPRDYARPENQLPEGTVSQEDQDQLMTPADNLVRFPELPPEWLANATKQEPEIPMCKPMLMSMELPAPIGPKLFVLGEPVLRKYYTVYDSQKGMPRIGFGLAKHVERFVEPSPLQEGDDPLP